MNNKSSKRTVLLAGNSHPEFARMIATHLDLKIGNCSIYFKSNRESRILLKETVRGRDVYIIQSGTKNVNNDVMETLIMVYTCKTNDAHSITVVMPYLPYCRQSKMTKRGSIVMQLMAQMLCHSGISKLITLDLHAKEIQGFFQVPVDNLRASPFLLRYIEDNVPDFRNAVVVARSPLVVARATSFAERIRVPVAIIHGVEKSGLDGRNSPPPAQLEEERAARRKRNESYSPGMELLPPRVPKEKPPMELVGDVSGSIAIIVEDLIDDVVPFAAAASLLKRRGAYKVYVVVTHGLLDSDAPKKLEDSDIDELIMTNSLPHDVLKMQCSKVKTVDISMIIAEAIRRIQNNESMSYLFKDVPKDE